MSFDQLLAKVHQAETALEAHERTVAADFRQLAVSWRRAWTPGRIVIAGLVSGFTVGRAQLLKHATGGGILQIITALSGLLASGSAQTAADNADEAAQAANAGGPGAVGNVPAEGLQASTRPLPSDRRRAPDPGVTAPPWAAEAATDLSER